MSFRINLVEDETSLRNLLVSYLEREGYRVKAFGDGEEASRAVGSADLWVLDITVPRMDGYELLNLIRGENPAIPVIYISARDRDIDRVVGLEMGADDYLPKPFLPRELVIRTARLLKRVYGDKVPSPDEESGIEIGPYRLYPQRRTALHGEKPLDLTSREFDLLLLFSEKAGQAFSREQLIERIWGEGYHTSERVVDDLIRRLRKKMPHLKIETIYGFGYRMTES